MLLSVLVLVTSGCGGGESVISYSEADFAGAWLIAAEDGAGPTHWVVFLDGAGKVTGGGPSVSGGSYTFASDGRYSIQLSLAVGEAAIEGQLASITVGTARFDDGVTSWTGVLSRAGGVGNVWGGSLGGARPDGSDALVTFMSEPSGGLLWCDGLPLFTSGWIVRGDGSWAARLRTGSSSPHDDVFLSGTTSYPLHEGEVRFGGATGPAVGVVQLCVDLDMGGGQVVGTVSDSVITEASGLVASRRQGNVLWCHNDSGGGNYVYALTTDGASIATVSFDGPELADIEDIAIGPGPSAGVDYLYLGDVGDNGSTRGSIRVVRFPEPDLATGPYPISDGVTGSEALVFTYPTGADAPSHKDCEAVMIDPSTGDLYLATKRAAPNRIYRAAAPLLGGPTVLERVADLPAQWNDSGATGGDISPDGRFFLLRRYALSSPNAGIWSRGVDVPWSMALGRPYMQPFLTFDGQGEAICWHGTMDGFFTTQEGSRQAIRFYPRRRP